MSALRRFVNVMAGSLAVLLVGLGVFAVQADRAPGGDGVKAGVAHWGRAHGLSNELGWLERMHDDLAPR